jgi:mannosyl-oligosaccharide alpha-1,2-mannosidase
MKVWSSLGLVPLILQTSVALPQSPPLKARNDRRDYPSQSQQRADAVIEAFRYAWTGYETYAFGHDELHPVTNTYGDSR